MSEGQTPNSISQEPVNILFSPSSVVKKDVWEINLIQILNLLIKILEKSGKKDLKVAGMAALSSSLIYRMKVESIFALQKAAMEKKSIRQRTNVGIDLINIPYRHESTYPVSLDDLLGLLQNLIGSIANPQSRRNRQVEIEPIEAPDFQEYFILLIVGISGGIVTAIIATLPAFITGNQNVSFSFLTFLIIIFLLNGIIWIDDDLIWNLKAEKIYSNEPKTIIRIEKVG